jgi:hypothetical protein
MRLCSYVVVHDYGFAPNPFHGYCTLAACTPNHQGLRITAGDWLLGNSTAATGNHLIYAMRVTEAMDFDDYFREPRFTAKKARREGWQNQCGDNIYYRDGIGRWRQALAFYHTEAGRLEKDTVHPRVFISDFFFYFGGQAAAVPAEFGSLLRTRQGLSLQSRFWNRGRFRRVADQHLLSRPPWAAARQSWSGNAPTIACTVRRPQVRASPERLTIGCRGCGALHGFELPQVLRAGPAPLTLVSLGFSSPTVRLNNGAVSQPTGFAMPQVSTTREPRTSPRDVLRLPLAPRGETHGIPQSERSPESLSY